MLKASDYLAHLGFAVDIQVLLLAGIMDPKVLSGREAELMDQALSFIGRGEVGIKFIAERTNQGYLCEYLDEAKACLRFHELPPDAPIDALYERNSNVRESLRAACEGRLRAFCEQKPEAVEAALSFFHRMSHVSLAKYNSETRDRSFVEACSY